MKSSSTRWCLALGISALAACSRDPPSAPRLYSLTGHLRITGFLVDPDGRFAGTRVLGDADGVPVELLHGSEVVGRTTTAGGVYRFPGLAPGGYVARSQVIGDIADETGPMTIASTSVSAADTLRLVSRGDLYPVPNPFEDTTEVFFSVPEPGWVDVRILDAGGNSVRKLLVQEVMPARHIVSWDTRDQGGRPVTGSLFWVTFAAGNDVRAQALFRGPSR